MNENINNEGLQQPVQPAVPVQPVAPQAPVAPVAPAQPVAPVQPAQPAAPVQPVEPTTISPAEDVEPDSFDDDNVDLEGFTLPVDDDDEEVGSVELNEEDVQTIAIVEGMPDDVRAAVEKFNNRAQKLNNFKKGLKQTLEEEANAPEPEFDDDDDMDYDLDDNDTDDVAPVALEGNGNSGSSLDDLNSFFG